MRVKLLDQEPLLGFKHLTDRHSPIMSQTQLPLLYADPCQENQKSMPAIVFIYYLFTCAS